VTPVPTPTPPVRVGPVDVWSSFTGDGAATLIAGILAALVVVLGLWFQKGQERRAEQARVYGEAIRAVQDYLEAPYRVRRRDGGAVARMAITDFVSDVQSRLAYYETLLQLHAPSAVSKEYSALVTIAKAEAGPQMTAAWQGRPTRRDRDVPLGDKLEQPRSAAALRATTEVMGQWRARK
jgi:hypothetical protein